MGFMVIGFVEVNICGVRSGARDEDENRDEDEWGAKDDVEEDGEVGAADETIEEEDNIDWLGRAGGGGGAAGVEHSDRNELAIKLALG